MFVVFESGGSIEVVFLYALLVKKFDGLWSYFVFEETDFLVNLIALVLLWRFVLVGDYYEFGVIEEEEVVFERFVLF